MQRKWMWTIVVLVVAAGVGWYFWPRSPNQWTPFELLHYQDVQKELKLSDDQISKIKTLLDKSWKDYQELGLDKENAAKKKKIARDTFDALDKLLTPEQLHRMVQLQRQQLGPATFYDPGTARVLKLTTKQKDKMNEVLDKSALKRFELYNDKAFKKLAELDKKILSELLNVLDEEQQRGFQKMLGEPFKGKLPPPDYFPPPKKVQAEQ